MDFFELFHLAPSFFLDEKALRRAYLANSKRLHPDFFTQDDPAQQAEALALSSRNNEAYETLSDFDRRIQYILQQADMLQDIGTTTLPQSFLFEMMDINEAVADLLDNPDPQRIAATKTQIESIEHDLYEAVKPAMEAFDPSGDLPSQLQAVKFFFLKKRYLLRIVEKLSIFADA